MKRFVLAALLSLAVCAPASGQLVPVTIPGRDAHVDYKPTSVAPKTGLVREPGFASWRIRVPGAAGSGTSIGSRLVCTNAHVVGGSQYATVQSDIMSREIQGYVIQSDREQDIALIILQEDVPYVAIAEAMKRGDDLYLYGYSRAGVLRHNRTPGKYIDGTGRGIKTQLQSISGDSGGGIFNGSGELAAVNWGSTDTDGGYSISNSVGILRSEIQELYSQWGRPQGSCPDCGPPSRGGGGGGPEPRIPFVPEPAPETPTPAPVGPELKPEPPPTPPAPGCDCDLDEIVLRLQKLEANDEALAKELELLKKALDGLQGKLDQNTLADQLMVVEIQKLRETISLLEGRAGDLEAHLKGRMHLKFAVDPASGRVELLSTSKE